MHLLTDKIKHGESPRWAEDRVWFSDVHDYAVKTVDLSGSLTRVAEVPARPSGLGRLPDGTWLVVSALDSKLNLVGPDGLREVCDLTGVTLGLPGDMVVDGHGRAYISDTGFNHGAGEEHRLGRVLLWEAGKGIRIAAEGTDWANGSAISPDGSRFYLAETFGERVSVFDIDADGGLSGRRTFAELGTLTDGICLDAERGVWVGLPVAGEFVHLDRHGRADRHLQTRASLATACVLGGQDRRTLFACSVNSTPETLSRGETQGGVIESTPVDVPGVGWP